MKNRQWCRLAMVLLVAFVLGGSQLLAHLTGFAGIVPIARAASDITFHEQGDCTSKHHSPSFGGTVVVDRGQVECGNLTTFGSTVVVNGEVQGDIVAFNSITVIAGTVDGNIDIYGGSVTLQSDSYVDGDVHLYGGRWVGDQNIHLSGTVIDETKHVNWLFAGRGFSFVFWFLLVWVGLGFLLTSSLPEHVMIVRTTVVNNTRRSAIIGLLSALLALPVMIVLVALILSIPLAIIVGLGLVAAWTLGTVAVGWLIGEYILSRVAPHQNTRTMQAVVGLIVLVLAGSVPYIGCLISLGAGLLGLGAVFLSRFGTRLYSPPKDPLKL
jgi:Polymer-forming cytoskeletal